MPPKMPSTLEYLHYRLTCVRIDPKLFQNDGLVKSPSTDPAKGGVKSRHLNSLQVPGESRHLAITGAGLPAS